MSDIDQAAAEPSHRPLAGRMLFAALLASIAGLMFGLDIGVISGARQFIAHEFNASNTEQGLIVSFMMFGAMAGALGANPISLHLGRRMALIISAFLFVLGSLLCAFAPSAIFLMVARAVLGLAVGVASFVAPLYISEVADERRRGGLISTYQLMVTIGILLAFVSDAILAYWGAWRMMLGIVAVPGILFFIGAFFLPDSPRWLMLRGREKEALAVLHDLRESQSEVSREVEDIKEQLEIKKSQRGFGMFLQDGNFRRAVFLGIVLQLVQQLTGINAVMYFAPTIFESSGFGQDGALWSTAIVGLVNCLATFIAIGYADNFGRRRLLTVGFFAMALGMGGLAVLLTIGVDTSPILPYLSVGFLLLFIVGFASSAGPMIWVLCSEIQPLKGRDFGVTCSTFSNWSTNFVIGLTFLPLLSMLGAGNTMWLFAALNAAFIIFTQSFVPETKDVSLESIESKLRRGIRLRDIGQ
ncbi:Arabinose-proton symporter [Acetobacteraceae bacterium EV16G]|uniref:Arabinose-proton symporter n=1 Tax=Sorlinia euscelidii TaxID=3081148 RepID=A0ABU7U446_9PROT